MSLQDSTFKTAHVLDNEIIKANDIEFAFEQLVENVSKATQMFLESNQDFVINGKVVPDIGMNVRVSPIYGVCKSTGKPFGRTETTDETIGFAGSTSGRIDILEVQGDWETYDNQQRAFNDPDTDTQTYQYVDTKKLMKPVYQVKEGVEGSGIAPEVDSGWVKLAEVSIRAGATSIIASDIHNITADIAGLDNDDWTNEKDATFNIGYITDINSRFREQHNEDGTHKENVINAVSLDIGTGTNQINGNILPVGGNVSLPNEPIAITDSILSVRTKVTALITTLYNAYLQYGTYGFKGELKVSSIFENNALKKPISIVAAGDGTAVIKIDGNAVLSIDANGKLSTNGYTPSSNNHIVTKVITDALASSITSLANRVSALENAQGTFTANKVLSSGTDGQFNISNVSIYAATTENITLSGSQVIDGMSLTDGQNVLVKNQTNAKENGVYQYSSNSAWSRITEFNQPILLKGKILKVINGTVNKGKLIYLLNEIFQDQESFGTDNINFAEYFGSISPLANKLIMRDEYGRAQVEAPSASKDIARKAEIDNLYGNVAGCPLGDAAVGTATTFARSDHVHPVQSGIPNSGFATCCFTWVSTSASFAGAPANWAHYLISSHGDGSSYYNYIIREPFSGVPQYSRMVNGSQSGWYNFITDENIWAQTVSCATSAGTADLATTAKDACCLQGYQPSVSAAISSVVARDPEGNIYGVSYNTSAADSDIKSFNGTSLMYADGNGWMRRTPASCVYVGCATDALRSQAAYARVSTCSFIGGGLALIYYCAANTDMSWITNSYVLLNGIRAGSSCQFDLSTMVPNLCTSDGKYLGVLCFDRQWHLLGTCPDATGGIFEYNFLVQLAAIVA